MICALFGCQTAPKQKIESTQEVVSALGSVTEGLTNQNLSEEDLKKLAVAAQKDPKTQSALRSVNQALSVEQTGIKYCPVDGQRFSANVIDCPIHKVKLKDLE